MRVHGGGPYAHGVRTYAVTAPMILGAESWWWSPVGMVTIGLVGLLVVAVVGLGLAVVIGLVVGRRRHGHGADTVPDEPDSTGTPFK